MALFLTATGIGDRQRAQGALSTCVRMAEELGLPVLRWRAAYLQGHWVLANGRLDEVEQWSAESQRLGDAAGQPDTDPFWNAPLAVTRLLQGRAGEAVDLLTPVIARFPTVAWQSAARAWALSEDGRADEARLVLADHRRPGAFGGVPADYMRLIVLSTLARACYRIHEPAMAEELFELLLPFRGAMATMQSTWLGPVTHDLGLLATVLGRHDDAHGYFAQAVETQDRIGARAAVVHTRLEWARMLLGRDRAHGPQARTLLDEAKAGAQEVGIPIVEARIDELASLVNELGRESS